MGRWAGVVVGLVALCAEPGSARAGDSDWGDDEELSEAPRPRRVEPVGAKRSFSDAPVHLMAMVGFGTLTGFVGLTTGYNVHHRLELGAGVGFNAQGMMGGPYARIRPFAVARQKSRTLHAVAIDLGLSMGGYAYRQSFAGAALAHSPANEHPYYHSDFAMFLQSEVSWEMVKLGGFSMRAGAGVTTLLNPGNISCDEPTSEYPIDACEDPPGLFPVMLFQVGTAL